MIHQTEGTERVMFFKTQRQYSDTEKTKLHTHTNNCFTACHQGVLSKQQDVFWTAYLLAGGRQMNTLTHKVLHHCLRDGSYN